MATPKSMRISVEVLPLELDDRHAEYSKAHAEALKGRRFALPVQLDYTLGQVWTLVEERYKKNYLDPRQSAYFTIKKLQDAYDCDLDLSDTVSSIFEGENDPTKRMIKVVPSIINREFSVPITTNLRPAQTQKRSRESPRSGNSKRIRLDREESQAADLHRTRDRPLPSTESEHSGGHRSLSNAPRSVPNNADLRRSISRSSLVFVHDSQTGGREFAPSVKEESPELGLNFVRTIPESESPKSRLKKPPSPRGFSTQPRHRSLSLGEPLEPVQETDDVVMGEDQGSAEQDAYNSQEELNQDPVSSPTSDASLSQQSANIHDRADRAVGTPSFIGSSQKPRRTYGKTPHTPRLHQPKETPTRSNTKSGVERARSFQTPKADNIVSTPDGASRNSQGKELEAPAFDVSENNIDEIATPQRDQRSTSAKSSTLKKPSKKSFIMPPPANSSAMADTPSSNHRGRKTSSNSSAVSDLRRSVLTKNPTPPLRHRLASPKVVIPSKKPHQPPAGDRSNNISGSRKSITPASNGDAASTGDADAEAQLLQEFAQDAKSQSLPADVTAGDAVNGIPPPIQASTPRRVVVPPPANVQPSTAINGITTTNLSASGKKPLFKFPKKNLSGTMGANRTLSDTPETPSTNGTPSKANASLKATKESPNLFDPAEALNASQKGRPVSNRAPQSNRLSTTQSLRKPSMKTSGTPLAKRAPQTHEEHETIELSSGEEDSSADYTPEEEEKPQTKRVPPTALRRGDAQPSRVVPESRKRSQVDNANKVQSQNMDVSNEEEGAKAIQTKPLNKTSQLPSSKKSDMAQPTAWNASSWGFGAIDQNDGTAEQPFDDQLISAAAVQPDVQNHSEPDSGSEADMESHSRSRSKSRSASAAASNRSSPATQRIPVRLLTNSPTKSNSSNDEDEEDETSVPPMAKPVNGKAESSTSSEDGSSSDEGEEDGASAPSIPAPVVNGGAKNSASSEDDSSSSEDSDSESSSSSSEAETKAKDVEMPDAIKSSPPLRNRAPQPPPPSSMPVRNTPVPLPPPRPIVKNGTRPLARGKLFPSLTNQLMSQKAAATKSAKPAFDPRTSKLGAPQKGKATPLQKNAGAKKVINGVSDSSSDESSSGDEEELATLGSKMRAGKR